MTTAQNEAAAESATATPWRRPLTIATLIGSWMCAVAALVLMAGEAIHIGHGTWDTWLGVIGEVIGVALFMNLDIVTAHTGASYWLSLTAPYLPLAALAMESYPSPGGSLAAWIPLQTILVILVVGAYLPTRALVLAHLGRGAGDSEQE